MAGIEADVTELEEAVDGKRYSEAWSLARKIAKTKKGPNRKWGNTPNTAAPTVSQWIEKLEMKGSWTNGNM